MYSIHRYRYIYITIVMGDLVYSIHSCSYSYSYKAVFLHCWK